MLCIGGRTPYKTLFARASGRVWQADFSPQYSDRGTLERVESVPFRLTRNLHTFFTPFGVEGMFVSALAAGAEARPARTPASRTPCLHAVTAQPLNQNLAPWTQPTPHVWADCIWQCSCACRPMPRAVRMHGYRN